MIELPVRLSGSSQISEAESFDTTLPLMTVMLGLTQNEAPRSKLRGIARVREASE